MHMKKLAVITAFTGALLAVLAYFGSEMHLIGIKAFFQMGLVSLSMLIISAAYFLISSIREWAAETEFFKRIF